jgi:hypothetical protein
MRDEPESPAGAGAREPGSGSSASGLSPAGQPGSRPVCAASNALKRPPSADSEHKGGRDSAARAMGATPVRAPGPPGVRQTEPGRRLPPLEPPVSRC